MSTGLKELIAAYLKIDAELDKQQIHAAQLRFEKSNITKSLAAALCPKIPVDEELYLKVEDEILRIQDYDGCLTIELIKPTAIDELADLNPE